MIVARGGVWEGYPSFELTADSTPVTALRVSKPAIDGLGRGQEGVVREPVVINAEKIGVLTLSYEAVKVPPVVRGLWLEDEVRGESEKDTSARSAVIRAPSLLERRGEAPH